MRIDRNEIRKIALLAVPYLLFGLYCTNLGEGWRLAQGTNTSEKILSFMTTLPAALSGIFPSFHPFDLFVGAACGILLRLAGDYQLENARTALAAIEVLTLNGELDISPEDIRRGLFNAVNPARLETLCGSPLVLLDGAHNPNGIGALKQAIDRFLEGKKILCVLGMLADKDIDSALRLLDGVFEAIYTVPIDNPRALAPDLLAEKCRSHAAEVRAFDSAELAFDTAFERAERENAAVLVCGSLYLAGSIRPYILTHVK